LNANFFGNAAPRSGSHIPETPRSVEANFPPAKNQSQGQPDAPRRLNPRPP